MDCPYPVLPGSVVSDEVVDMEEITVPPHKKSHQQLDLEASHQQSFECLSVVDSTTTLPCSVRSGKVVKTKCQRPVSTKQSNLSGSVVFGEVDETEFRRPISTNQSNLQSDAVLPGEQSSRLELITTHVYKEENPIRGNWSGRLDFLLSCLGYAVGLGNVLRFPYLCYQNGGGAFLIPYTIMLLFVGIPIFFMEISLGQFSSSGVLVVWKLCPLFAGIGIAMVIASALAVIYYNVIIAWAVFYLINSFGSSGTLPWSFCPLNDSSKLCLHKVPDVTEEDCTAKQHTVNKIDGYCYNKDVKVGLWNASLAEEADVGRHLPSQDYMDYVALRSAHSDGLGDLGKIHWRMALCLLLVWAVIFLCLAKGIKASGKIVYVTTLMPYVILIVLLVNGALLDGHLDGIKFYLRPDFSKLHTGDVWRQAASQIFFSMSASFGGLISLASYNKFHQDCLRDSLIITFSNSTTSFLAGFVIFSYIGHLSKTLNVDIEKVAKSGVTLAFAIYLEAVAKLPYPPLWSILFFVMLITLGLDSAFGLVETVITGFMDIWSPFRRKKELTCLVVCVLLFLPGLSMCTDGGVHILRWLDKYAAGWNMLVIALLECVCVAGVYGINRFRKDIQVMIGIKYCRCVPWWGSSYWWIICWCFVTPAGLLFVLIYPLLSYTIPTNETVASEVCGNMIVSGSGIFVIIAVAVVTIYKKKKAAFKPTRDWGPSLVCFRELVATYVDDYVIDPWDQTENENWRRQRIATSDGGQRIDQAQEDVISIKVDMQSEV